jgi:SH3 domain protein
LFRLISRYFKSIFVGLLLPVLLVSAAVAQDRWVTDEFEIMMRSGKSSKQRIIRQLQSGVQLELLQTDDESEFSEVKTSNGDKGWVLTRYLRSTPTSQLRLPELENSLERSATQNKALRSEIDELKKAKQRLQRAESKLQLSKRSLQGQVDRISKLSANTIQVDDENKQLKQQLADSQAAVSVLEIDNAQLASRSDREWFLVGGGVLVLGLLFGLILPRISWRKKDSWSNL